MRRPEFAPQFIKRLEEVCRLQGAGDRSINQRNDDRKQYHWSLPSATDTRHTLC